MAFLGGAYFLLMFLPIPFTDRSALNGYWTPRLILPPLLLFFCAGFLLIDRKIGCKSKTIAEAVLTLAIAQSAIEIVMLAGINLAEPPVTAFEGGRGDGKGQFDEPRPLDDPVVRDPDPRDAVGSRPIRRDTTNPGED